MLRIGSIILSWHSLGLPYNYFTSNLVSHVQDAFYVFTQWNALVTPRGNIDHHTQVVSVHLNFSSSLIDIQIAKYLS